jgi:hypothetical protein
MLVVAASVAFLPRIQAQFDTGCLELSCPVDQSCAQPAPTELGTGPNSDDLKVHVVGKSRDTIEVYFKTEYFYREQFAGAACLQQGNAIALACKNKFGTFSVRLDNKSIVKAYGWRANKEKPESIEIPVTKNCRVVMEWVTDRILKVRHGHGLSKSTIVRFNDADNAWTELFKD